MERYSRPVLGIAFQGPDLGEEQLFSILRVSHNCYLAYRPLTLCSLMVT